jgi:Zn-dependent peptidase ImmA (M78 family)
VHIYETVNNLAREKRAKYQIDTASLNLTAVRRIYAAEGIHIDQWTFGSTIRAVYMCDDGDPSVAINNRLPRIPKLFSLVHELKHHYLDVPLIQNSKFKCGDYNANEQIEKAAEVFAAEFIYPEAEFLECVNGLGLTFENCTPEMIVRLKRICNAPVSYQFLCKRLVRLGFGQEATFSRVQFQKLEEKLYGLPIYKQPWFKARRQSRRASR